MTYETILNLAPGTLVGFFETDVIIEIISINPKAETIKYRYVAGINNDSIREWAIDTSDPVDFFVLTDLLQELL